MTASGRFTRGVLLRQSLIGAAALVVVAVFTHKLIVLDWEVTRAAFRTGAVLAAVGSFVSLLVSYLHIRKHRFVVEAIMQPRPRPSGAGVAGARVESPSGATNVEALRGPASARGDVIAPEDVGRLAALPNALTLRFLAVSAAASAAILVPGIRPPILDDGRAVGLVILTITIFAASSLPHYVLTRHATTKLLERCPLDPLSVLLESFELEQITERRVTQKLLLAVVPPVALLGVGVLLVSHAHLRTLAEQSSVATAQVLARTALEPSPTESAAREAAIAAAAQLGFQARVRPGSAMEGGFSREGDGRLSVDEPVDDGRAIVSFMPDLGPDDTTGGAVIAALAVALAAIFGSLFGRALSDDLSLATRSVRLLGTESVIRGRTRIARPARFAVVAELGRAIEGLTERFRVFAAAQERALEARLAAQRMRGLLFASVSHDLKSPLNAILGFAELLSSEELTAAQKESLGLIAQRGRELLALIETILDAARVEAGQLQLIPKEIEVATLVADATRKARELANEPGAPIVVEIADHLPALAIDATHGARAVAVVVGHALRNAAARRAGRSVRVRAYEATDDGVHVDVEYGRGDTTPEELEALFARQPTSRARGLTLGLSLARSVVELHGGCLEVHAAPDGSPICQITFPLDIPDVPPRLSSIPALG